MNDSSETTEQKSRKGCGCLFAILACLFFPTVIFLIAVFYFRLAAPVLVEETFEAGDTGWLVVGDAQGESDKPTYQEEGGNPGAYMSAVDNAVGGVWFWSAPESFLATLQDSWTDRGSLRAWLLFDLMQSDTSEPFEDKDVLLGAGDLELHYRHAKPPGTEWTPYRIPLRPEKWINPATDAPATPEEMNQVLSGLDRLWIRGEFRTGPDTGGIDNIRVR